MTIETFLTAQVVPLTGRVVLEDGSPPPKGLTVMSTCGNLATSRDGTFNFTSGYSLDGSHRCDLLVSLRGFRTVREVLPDKDEVRIILRRIGSEGALPASIDLKALVCSARLGHSYGEAEAAMGLQEWATAEKWLRRAVEACPAHSRAWDELGLALEMQGRRAEARAAYEKAVAADSRFVMPVVHLAGLALTASQNGEALQLSERALRLNPVDMPRAWFYHCVASFDAGHFEAAEKSARRTIEEDRGHGFPRAEYLLGVLLVRKGESTEAEAHLRTFLKLAPGDADAGRARQLTAIQK